MCVSWRCTTNPGKKLFSMAQNNFNNNDFYEVDVMSGLANVMSDLKSMHQRLKDDIFPLLGLSLLNRKMTK